MPRPYFYALLLLGCVVQPGLASEPRRVVEFNRDIRPILSDNCFSCHGPDKQLRKGRLRLDREDGLFDDRHILVAGKPDESELFKRVIETDPSHKMPPAKSNKTLTREQIDLLRLWIEQGAKYQKHWAFLAPRQVDLPAIKDKSWPRNPIDHFVLAPLERAGLTPAPEADRRTLIRRLSFDLLGLPPSPAEVDAFTSDNSPNAYEKLVDRLLASPHFGERMAVHWLDLVRYADSEGYSLDFPREVHPYRDWVIDAFNRNMKFDEFTIAQLAGDLLPQATRSQQTASGYNRMLQTTAAKGQFVKEYQAKFHADRVRNLSNVWLALTLGCCECHDHKNDPLTTREFYQLEAFFADIQDFNAQNLKPLDPTVREHDRKKNELESLQKRKDSGRGSWTKKAWWFITAPIVVPFAWIVAASGAVVHFLASFALSAEVSTQKKDVTELKAYLDQEKARRLFASQITETGPPGAIRVLPAGNWLDETGEVVAPNTPAILPPLGSAETRPTRLDLGRWLMKPENPLPTRVFVNRLWMFTFGQGLVRTPDDFGAQGASPSHPELLDWLAVDFQKNGGDIKRTIKQIVLSATYRQSSKETPELRQRDPLNQLLARQGRFRLDGEFVRDNALAISGLLVTKIGGPSVKPYQPDGYWENAYDTWKDDAAPDQYRRGLYTFWRRTYLHPSLQVLDAPTREDCTVERPRSNTPQQALVLLNDPTYVEAARVFGQRILVKGGKSSEERIRYAIREALQRPARDEELTVLQELLERHWTQYKADPAAAQALLRVGHSATPEVASPSELAAWTSVAQVILNLHESITRY